MNKKVLILLSLFCLIFIAAIPTPYPLSQEFLSYTLTTASEFVGAASNGILFLAEKPASDFVLPKGFTSYIVTGIFDFKQSIPPCCKGLSGSSCFDCSSCTTTPVVTTTPIVTITPVVTTTSTPVVTTTPIPPVVLNKCGGAWGSPCTCISGATQYTQGCTFSGPYYRTTDGTKVLLTNAHCLYKPTSKGLVDYRVFTNPDGTPFRWFFPSPLDKGTYSPGFAWFAWPVAPANMSTQYYDAGVVKIDDSNFSTSKMCMLATQSSFSDPFLGQQLDKNGRTTGYTLNKVVATNVCVKVGIPTNYFNFCGQAVVSSLTAGKDPMGPGDSGSLFIDHTDPNKAVCLGFAGSEQGYGICSPMSKVMGGLHIQFTKP